MPLEVFANLPHTTVSSGGTTAPAGGTTETWTVASSSSFPAVSNSTSPPTQLHVSDTALNSEIIAVTNISGTTWTVTRGAESTTPVAHSAGFTVYQVVTGGAYGAFTQYYNVRSLVYGAKGNGSTDDTTAIQAALTAAGNAGGGVVYCPAGTYLTGALTIPQNVSLRGDGIVATTLLLNSTVAQFGNLLMNAQLIGSTFDANCCQVHDMTLDGNSGAMSAGWWNSGLVLSNRDPSGSPEYVDGRHQASNLLIQNFTGDGLVQDGRGASQFSDIQVWICNGFGVNVNEDCYYSNIDVGASGLDGFLVQGGSNRFSGCKAWFSGANLTSSRSTGASALTVSPPSGAGAPAWDGSGLTGGIPFSLANGFGNGWNILDLSGTSPAGVHNANSFSACCAQDNARSGFSLNGSRPVLVACDADSNSNCGCTSGTTPLASFAGFEINSDLCQVDGISWDRAANTNHQAAAVSFISGDPNCQIKLSFSGTLNDGSNMPPLLASSSTNTQSSLKFNGTGDGSIQFPSFASSYTPDPYLGEVVSMTLTGNITVNAPKLTGTNTTGIFLVPGQRLTLMLTQDGTGSRSVTLNSVFRLNGKSFSTSANATTSITFIWDTSHWQAQG